MRSVQEILNVIIDTGFYRKEEFMCLSATRAYLMGIITASELSLVKSSIGKFIAPYMSLYGYIPYHNTVGDREFIYRNWDDFTLTFNKRFGKLLWRFKIIKNRINLLLRRHT